MQVACGLNQYLVPHRTDGLEICLRIVSLRLFVPHRTDGLENGDDVKDTRKSVPHRTDGLENAKTARTSLTAFPIAQMA